MGRRIAIIGAGQSGLQLGIGLLKNNYSVTIYTDRNADDILNGSPMSSQAMFHLALSCERELGINFWDDEAPKNDNVKFTLSDEKSEKQFSWNAKTQHLFQSVDQRIKFPAWMRFFESLGGKFVYCKLAPKDIKVIHGKSDLVILATGKGELGNLLPIDKKKTVFNMPQRRLALTYVKTKKPRKDNGVRFTVVPGIGEFFTLTGLSFSGPCEMMLFEGLPGGAFDCWDQVLCPQEQLDISLKLLKEFIPWEYTFFQDACLADECSTLIGGYTPQVRVPYYECEKNCYILGMADAVVLNDPIAGQGSNNASKCAKIYMKSILDHGNRDFDLNWMKKTFNDFWEDAKWSVEWSNMLLTNLPDYVKSLLFEASRLPEIATMLANSFDSPKSLFPWILNEGEVRKFIMNSAVNKN